MTDIQTGFLLARNSHDRSRHTEIVLWVVTAQGPARLVVEGEQPVFFVNTRDQLAAERALKQSGVSFRSRPLALETFAGEPVTALYFLTQELCWQGRKALGHNGMTCFEADFRLHDRYLMERFICGGVEFFGQPRECEGYTEYRQVRLRPANVVPEFRVMSLDIECSSEGELYSAGLFGHNLKGVEAGLVIMIGLDSKKDSPADFDIVWVDDEPALLQELVKTIQLWNPDIITGWNVINFDFPAPPETG